MSIKFIETSIPDLKLIEPEVFEDDRGFLLETYRYEKYLEQNLKTPFVQDNHSHSGSNVLRGLHYQIQRPQGKLIMAVTGEIFDVAVDLRASSPTFGQWFGTVLSAKNHRQLFVPPGFAHGFYVLSDQVDVWYKCTEYYYPEHNRGILWSDPQVGIDWPSEDPKLSEKDQKAPTLKEAAQNGDLFS